MSRDFQAVNVQEVNVFKRHSTSSLLDKFVPMMAPVGRYMTLCLFAFGIIGNIVAIIVWWYPRLRIRESTVLSFVFLSAIDIMFSLLTIMDDFDKMWSVSLFYNDGLCKLFQVVHSAFCFLSLWMVLAICIQHILSLKRPDSYEYYKYKKWTYLIVLLLFTVSIMFSIGEGVFATIVNENPNTHECNLPRDILTTNTNYKIYYWLVKFFLTSVLIISISGACIYILHLSNLEIEKRECFHNIDCTLSEKGFCRCSNIEDENASKNSISLSKTVPIVGFYSVFITLPQLILISLEPLNTPGDTQMVDLEVLADPVWERYFNIIGAKIIFNELFLSKFSINILIYICCSKYFRKCFREIFGISKFFQTFKLKITKPERKSSSRSHVKPISYYIGRSQNSNPFVEDANISRTPKVTPRRSLGKSMDNNKIHRHPRNPNIRTIERSNIPLKMPVRLEPIYYSVPRSKTPRSRMDRSHNHRIRKSHVNSTQTENPIPKPKSKVFHNVFSEFEYVGHSASTSPEESPIIYVKNCHCHDGHSNASFDEIFTKSKHKKHRYHQV